MLKASLRQDGRDVPILSEGRVGAASKSVGFWSQPNSLQNHAKKENKFI